MQYGVETTQNACTVHLYHIQQTTLLTYIMYRYIVFNKFPCKMLNIKPFVTSLYSWVIGTKVCTLVSFVTCFFLHINTSWRSIGNLFSKMRIKTFKSYDKRYNDDIIKMVYVLVDMIFIDLGKSVICQIIFIPMKRNGITLQADI